MFVKRLFFLSLTLLVLAGGLVAGCGGSPAASDHALSMVSLAEMPSEVQSAPALVRESYQFAVANPEVMKHIPCYCGCGAMGHTSNYACYVKEARADGSLDYDSHALGCSICVDITQDTMRLLKQGKSIPEIRTYVDTTYAKYGASNMP